MDRVVLVDVFSLVYQLFHAIRGPMSSPDGEPTNAVFGFARDLKAMLDRHKPTHVVCAMESASDTDGVRNEWYPEYKANRSAMPDELRSQIPKVIELMQASGIPDISFPGWEADDIIATLSTRASNAGKEVVIVTSDKDARQLLGPTVRIFNLRKGEYYDEASLLEDWGIRPDQVTQFQSLVGDSVDNVPGVPGVGPKRASQLLAEFETLEGVLANADKAPGKKLKENLVKHADDARMSLRLVTLNTDLPLEATWDDIALARPDKPRLLELYKKWDFRSLKQDLEKELLDSAESKPELSATTIDTSEQLDELVSRAVEETEMACFAIGPSRSPIGFAIAWEPAAAYYIPVASHEPQHLTRSLKSITESPGVRICGHNLKREWHALRAVDADIRELGMDAMIGHYLLDAGGRDHDLATMAAGLLLQKLTSREELLGKGKNAKSLDEVDTHSLAAFAGERVTVALRLSRMIDQRLEEERLSSLYWNLERPLLEVLARMEQTGVTIDVDELRRQSEDVSQRLSHLTTEIHSLAGEEFNIDSPKQLRVVLFETLNLPVIKRTKTGPSTDQDVLEQLALQHELPAKIIEQRQLSKLKSTYLDTLPAMVNASTGRVHTTYGQASAATGRLSSGDPNLQNIPIRTEEGRRVRKAFVAPTGWQFVCADYSQIELRMLAHFSGDEELLAAFRDGEDIHTAVAADIFAVPDNEVTPHMRHVAKGVNFGVIYGQTAFGLANTIGIPKDEAAVFIRDYFSRYTGAVEFMEGVLTDCRARGYAETILGRRRPIRGVREHPTANRTLPERTAINTVIQGSAADLIKQAMIAIQNRLDRENSPARMLMQIHDELVFECPNEDVTAVGQLAREEMAGAIALDVPLVVDLSAGANWLETERQ